jgi:hypothetical protein
MSNQESKSAAKGGITTLVEKCGACNGFGHVENPVSAAEKPTGDLTDEQIDELFAPVAHPPAPTTLRNIARAIERAAIAAHLAQQPEEAQPVRAEVVERFADYSKIAHLIGSIFFAGDFKAETANKRELEALLAKTGHRYASWDEISAFRADDLPIEFSGAHLARQPKAEQPVTAVPPADVIAAAIRSIAEELELEASNYSGDFADVVTGCASALHDQAQALEVRAEGAAHTAAQAAGHSEPGLSIAIAINRKLGEYVAANKPALLLLNDEEMAALLRFKEVCEDFDAGGYDVPKEMMKRLAAIGVIESKGFGRYQFTDFGDFVVARRPASHAPNATLAASRDAESATSAAHLARQAQTNPVAVVDEGDDGLFIDIIYGPDGSPLKCGDKLYLAAPVTPAGAQPGLTMGEAFKAVGGWMNGGELGYPSFGSMNALWVYTVKMIRAYTEGQSAGAQNAEVIRNQALEEAALAAEKVQNDYSEQQGGKWPELRDDAATGAGDCVTAIRALQTGSANTQEGDA